MKDKYLAVKEWQKFAAGRGYKDDAFVKALTAAEKAENAPPAAQLTALEGVETAGRALLKLQKGDKKLEGYFDDALKAVQKWRKDAEKEQADEAKTAAAEAAAKAAKDATDAKGGSEPEEDEKAAAILDPKRLLIQLMACRKGPDRVVQFAFIDAKDKTPAYVAMSNKASGRKMFAVLSAELGVKTGAFGSAWVKEGELMLQPDKPLGGLAKKMRAPIKACGFRVSKIVLWNADGTVFEQDASAEDAEGEQDAATAQTAAAPDADAVPSEAALVARLKALLPRVIAAQSSLEGQAAKLLASEAGVFLRKGDWANAAANLDKLDKLFARMGNAPPATGPSPTDADAARFAADWNQARAQWQTASDSVDGQLEAFRAAILDWLSSDDEEVEVYGDALRDIADTGLNGLTKTRRVKLVASILDLGSGDPARAKAKAVAALQHVREFEGFIQTSAEVAATDDNPLDVPVSIRATLEPPLRQMATVLEAATRR